MYKVIESFADLHDNRHIYKAGDLFPREGVTVTADRVKELSSSNNRRGIPLIKAIDPPKKPVEAPNPPEKKTVEEVTVNKPKTANKNKSGGQRRSSGNSKQPATKQPRGKKQNAD